MVVQGRRVKIVVVGKTSRSRNSSRSVEVLVAVVVIFTVIELRERACRALKKKAEG